MIFIETDVFTSRIQRLGLEDDLRELQNDLLKNPLAGTTDAGTGGLRKTRMSSSGRNKGKRGGARVHYLYLDDLAQIFLIFVYSKDEDDSLTKDQKKALSKVVQEIKTNAERAR